MRRSAQKSLVLEREQEEFLYGKRAGFKVWGSGLGETWLIMSMNLTPATSEPERKSCSACSRHQPTLVSKARIAHHTRTFSMRQPSHHCPFPTAPIKPLQTSCASLLPPLVARHSSRFSPPRTSGRPSKSFSNTATPNCRHDLLSMNSFHDRFSLGACVFTSSRLKFGGRSVCFGRACLCFPFLRPDLRLSSDTCSRVSSVRVRA